MSSEQLSDQEEFFRVSNDVSSKFIQEMKNENTMKRNLESYESAVEEKSRNQQ